MQINNSFNMADAQQQVWPLLPLMHIQQLQDDEDMLNLIQRRRRRRARRRRRIWIRPWLGPERRLQHGQYHRLMPELRDEDPASYLNYLRVPPELFDELLERLRPRITRRDTWYRNALEPGLKLAMTIRHLASGDSYASMKFDFRVPHNTISLCVREVCQAIVDEYKNECIQCPTTEGEWEVISSEFERRWNVPNVCGALDGKHIACRRPRSSGSLYFNYKHFFSIVLLALVDADYKFLWIDVGGFGHMSDAQIFNASELKECLEDNSIGFPAPKPLPNDDTPMSFFILGDDAFGLRTYLMKPYAQRQMTKEQRIFNYRLDLNFKKIVISALKYMYMIHDVRSSVCPSVCNCNLGHNFGNTYMYPMVPHILKDHMSFSKSSFKVKGQIRMPIGDIRVKQTPRSCFGL